MESQYLELVPPRPTGRQILFKTIIGLIVWIFTAFLIFIILMFLWGMIQEALSNKINGVTAINPLLPLVLIVISFLWTFIGTIIIAGIYNLLYTDTYYDLGKMFNVTLLINVILFFFFIPLYLILSGNIDQLFVILAFHTIFAIFMSFVAIEMTTNPNYAAVHLVWVAWGLALSFIIYAAIYSIVDPTQGNGSYLLIVFPPLLAYTIIPFFHGVFESMYYKFYTMGNNALYIPSLNEVLVDDNEEDVAVVDQGND